MAALGRMRRTLFAPDATKRGKFHMNQDRADKFKTYIGDSVYADFDGYRLILTTENGYPDDPRNMIALEPAVFDCLLEYVKWLGERVAKKRQELAQDGLRQ